MSGYVGIGNKPKYLETFKKLTIEISDEELDNIISNLEICFREFKYKFNSYIKFFNDDESRIIEKNLLKYEKILLNRKKETDISDKKRKKDSNFRKMFTDYIDSDYLTEEEYCLANNISQNNLIRSASNLKSLDIDLYNKYQNARVLKAEKLKELVLKDFDVVLSKIGTKITDNDKERDYDIIDGLEDISFNHEKINNYAKRYLSLKDSTKIRTFFKNFTFNRKDGSLQKTIALNEKRIVDVQKDDKGNFIPDSGRVMTLEEKEILINFIEKKNIPFCRITYNCAIKRYLTGFIKKEEEKKLVLTNDNNA